MSPKQSVSSSPVYGTGDPSVDDDNRLQPVWTGDIRVTTGVKATGKCKESTGKEGEDQVFTGSDIDNRDRRNKSLATKDYVNECTVGDAGQGQHSNVSGKNQYSEKKKTATSAIQVSVTESIRGWEELRGIDLLAAVFKKISQEFTGTTVVLYKRKRFLVCNPA